MAIEEEVLSEISRSVSRVSESSESFRIAATQHNNNIQKVIKDISSMFRAQTSNQEELSSAIGGLRDEMSETNDKSDAVAARLNETVGVQSSMLTELRGIGRSIDQLNNLMNQMFMNQGGGGGGGGFGGGGGGAGGGTLGKILSGLIFTGKLAAVGIGGGAAASFLNRKRIEEEQGPTGGIVSPQNSPTTTGGVQTGSQSGSKEQQISQILASIKHQETRGESDPYTSVARGADNKPLELGPNTGTGAYQFTPDTWKESAAKANIDVSQYPQAKDAPQEIQDRVAKARASYLLEKAGGNVSLVPAYWRGGENIDTANLSPTVRAYQTDVMADYGKRQQEAAAQGNVSTSNTPMVSGDYADFLKSRSVSNVNAEKLNPTFAAKLIKAIQEAERVTGEKVTITSGFRSEEQQAQLYANYIGTDYNYKGKTYKPDPNAKQTNPVAEPGKSAHQSGTAVDLSSGAAREYIRKNASKFGLKDLQGDAPHFTDASETASEQTGVAETNQRTQQGATPTAASQGPVIANRQESPQSWLTAGLQPENMRTSNEPRQIGMQDMGSYNLLGVLGSTLGGNMFMPSGQAGAVGAALNMLSSASSEIQQIQQQTSQQNQPQQAQQAPVRGRVEADTYNHPEDRNVSATWAEKLMGVYSNETAGLGNTFGE